MPCTPPVNFCQADIAGGGDENRRRKTNWADWAYGGLPDAVEKKDDDYDGDNPEIWLRRAKNFGYAKIWLWRVKGQTGLRRTFFFTKEV